MPKEYLADLLPTQEDLQAQVLESEALLRSNRHSPLIQALLQVLSAKVKNNRMFLETEEDERKSNRYRGAIAELKLLAGTILLDVPMEEETE